MSGTLSVALGKRSLSRGSLHFFAAACGILLLGCTAVTCAQAPMQGPDPTFTSPNASSMSRESMSDAAGRINPVQAARIRKVQRAEIRESIAADSTRLVQLAQELNDQIGHEHPDTLTQAELKIYSDIGKLAHRLKSEMKNYGTAGSEIQPLPGLIPAPDTNGKHQR